MKIIPESERKQTRSGERDDGNYFFGLFRNGADATEWQPLWRLTDSAQNRHCHRWQSLIRAMRESVKPRGDSCSAISREAVTGEQVDSRNAAVSASIAILCLLRPINRRLPFAQHRDRPKVAPTAKLPSVPPSIQFLHQLFEWKIVFCANSKTFRLLFSIYFKTFERIRLITPPKKTFLSHNQDN